MLLALAWHTSVGAQDDLLQVGSFYGRASSVPIYFSTNTNYNCSESETIYKADELTAAGLISGDEIHRFIYKGYRLVEETNISLQVYVENTTDNAPPTTAATVCNVTNMTKVFDGITSLNSGGTSDTSLEGKINLITVEFDNPFTYTGNNLRVVVRHIADTPTGLAYCATSDASQNTKYRYKATEEALGTTSPSNSRNPILFIGTSPLSDYQLKLTSSEVPTSAVINEQSTFSYTVLNKGVALTSGSYTAKLFVGGAEVATATSSDIAVDASETFTFNYTPTTIGTVPVYAEFTFADNTKYRTPQTMLSIGDGLDHWAWDVNDNTWPEGVFYNAWNKVNNIIQLSSDHGYYLEPAAKTGNIFMTPKLHFTAGEKLYFDAAKYYGTVGDYTPSLVVMVSSDDRASWNSVKTLTESQMGGAQLGGSTSMIYAFTPQEITFAEEGDYYILFSGAARLDNFYGGSLVELNHDVFMTGSNLPSAGEVNNDLTAEVTVRNLLNAEETATAKYYINNKLIAEASEKTLTSQNEVTFQMTGKPHEAGTFNSYAEVILADGTVIRSADKEITLGEEVAKGELTVGTYNNYASSFPIATNNTGSFSDMLWNASTLQTAGITNGMKIKGIVFKGYNTNNEVTVPVKMWFGNSTATTQSTGSNPETDLANTTELTEVYNGNYTFAKAGSYGAANQVDIMTINFASPIEYTGGNLRVHAQCVQDEAQSTVNFSYTSTKGTSYKSYSPWSSQYSGNDSQYLPWVTFLYEKETSLFTGKATVLKADNTVENIANASLTLTAEDGVAYSGTTDEEGNFSIPVMQDNKTYAIDIDYSGANCLPMDMTVTFEGASINRDIQFVEGVDFYITDNDIPTEGRINNAYTATVSATNYNQTSLAADNYTAKLYIDGTMVAEATKTDVATMENKQFTFTYIPTTKGTFTAYIELAGPSRTVRTDDVNVTFDTDFYETASLTPAAATQNNRYTASVTVKNHRPTTLASTDYTAKFYLDDELTDTFTSVDIDAMAEQQLSFSFMPHDIKSYNARIEIISPTETIEKNYTINVSKESAGGDIVVGTKSNADNKTAFYWYDADATGGSFTDFYYVPEQLAQYNIKGGSTITAITFKANSLSSNKTLSNATWKVWVGLEDGDITAGTIDKTKMTEFVIYNGESATFTSGLVTKLDLSANPLVYDGTSKIRIYTETSGGWVSLTHDYDNSYKNNYYKKGSSGSWTLASGSPVATFTVEASKHYSGVVKMADGTLADGADVTLTNSENDVIYSGVTETDGTFDIEVAQHTLPFIVSASKGEQTYTSSEAIEFNAADITNQVIILQLPPQEEEVVVLNGESTTSATGVPFIFTKKHSQSETIYPASEIALEQGSKITKIEYKSLNVDTKELNTRVRIWLENTTDAPNTLPQDHKEQSMTLVYDGNINVTSHGNYVGYNNPANEYERFFSFTLDTPFEYDGSSNLRLVISQDGNDTSTNGTNTPRVLTDNTKNYSYVKTDNGSWGNPGTDEWDSTDLIWKGNYGTKASPVLFLTYVVEQTPAHELTLDEDQTWTPVADTFTKVTLKRTFQVGYNTVCLPFDIDNDTFKAKFGDDAEVYRFVDAFEGDVYFQKMDTPSLTADNAVVVKLNAAMTEIEFENVTTTANGPLDIDNEGVVFRGSYADHLNLNGDNGDYGIRPDGHVQKAGSGAFIRAFRAYLNTSNASGSLNITFFDEETGVREKFGEWTEPTANVWYTLDGQQISKPTKQGVYINNGKKVVIK